MTGMGTLDVGGLGGYSELGGLLGGYSATGSDDPQVSFYTREIRTPSSASTVWEKMIFKLL